MVLGVFLSPLGFIIRHLFGDLVTIATLDLSGDICYYYTMNKDNDTPNLINPVCPFCAKEVDADTDGMAYCGYCKEFVAAEEAEDESEWEAMPDEDPDLAAEVESEFLREEAQDKFEMDSRNFGFDDEYLDRHEGL